VAGNGHLRLQIFLKIRVDQTVRIHNNNVDCKGLIVDNRENTKMCVTERCNQKQQCLVMK